MDVLYLVRLFQIRGLAAVQEKELSILTPPLPGQGGPSTVVEIKPRSLCMLNKCSASELPPAPGQGHISNDW